jgi:hypothetical protein
MREDVARILREDAVQVQGVIDGKTPDLGLRGVGRILIDHLNLAADTIDELRQST